MINTYPELHRFRKELDSFQDELVGIIRELPVKKKKKSAESREDC